MKLETEYDLCKNNKYHDLLTVFLYTLVKQHLPIGVIEEIFSFARSRIRNKDLNISNFFDSEFMAEYAYKLGIELKRKYDSCEPGITLSEMTPLLELITPNDKCTNIDLDNILDEQVSKWVKESDKQELSSGEGDNDNLETKDEESKE